MLPPGSYTLGITIGALVIGPVATKLLAETGVDMPWFANTGVAGLLGFLLWWNIERGDKRSAKAIDDVNDELKGMRTDLKEGQDTTNSLLREALFQNRGPM